MVTGRLPRCHLENEPAAEPDPLAPRDRPVTISTSGKRAIMSVNRREVLKLAGAGGAALIGVPALARGRAMAATSTASATSSDVSFVGASSSGTRKRMIHDVLEPWRSTVAAGIAGKTVIVKPNLVALGSSWGGGGDRTLPCTHVDAVRAVLDFLRSISPSAKIIVADCSAAGSTSSVWSGAGYTALTSEYPGVTLQDLNDATAISTVNQTIWKPDLSATTTIPVSRAFADSKYYVISVTRPKTHDTLVLTGTTKNILMAAPMRSASGGSSTGPKRLMHGGTSSTKPVEAKCLSYNVFQLANLLYPSYAPALSVLDAWEGMEGDGPAGGSSVLQYCAAAGTDSLAVDRLQAMLMGFSDTATEPVDTSRPSYTDMRYLKWISDVGLGNYDLNKLHFMLGSLSAARSYIKKYKMHSGYASEVGWTGGPPKVLGASGGQSTPLLDPRPFLQPQSGQVRAGAASFTFALPVETGVRLGIFTAQGTQVRQLTNAQLGAGRYVVAWDGRDGHGSQVPAGTYVVRLGFRSRAAGAQERSLQDRITLTR
jgi:uncharacterized protein (DUF362 family)